MSEQTLFLVDIISQVCLSVFGLLAIFLIGQKNKWGFVFGLIQQPFWFFTTIKNQQWIIVALNVVYTAVWANGFYQWFIVKRSTP